MATDEAVAKPFALQFGRMSRAQVPLGKPQLEPERVGHDGHVYVGLSLTRNHPEQRLANAKSVSRQTQFDFNKIIDREYKFFAATNDDGWLVGGGESEDSYKLPLLDSAHSEIVSFGTYERKWGGVPQAEICELMNSGEILIPQMAITPSFVLANNDWPPEVELKFELERSKDKPVDEWPNWCMEFVQNQIYDKMQFPARFTPGAHHMTCVRKAAFRSEEAMKGYMQQCNDAVAGWRKKGPQVLTAETDPSKKGYPDSPIGEELTKPGGVYLFKDRTNPTHYFPPNFLPPYNTPEKRKVIAEVLQKHWHSPTLSWQTPEISGMPSMELATGVKDV